MTDINVVIESKYIRPAREIKVFKSVAILFMFCLFVMPQYFGIPFPLFDFTVLRISIIMVSFMIFADKDRSHDFIMMIKSSSFVYVLMPYLFVIIYTMVLRADINAFLNPFLELYSLCLMIYAINKSIGVKNAIKLVVWFSYILTILGIIEFVMGKTPFAYLETIKGLYSGAFIRSGSYRIMSSAAHSLGYGLLLITVVPFACFDEDTDTVKLMKRPLLLALFAINIMLTGSRSTLGVFIFELVLLVFITEREDRKRFLIGTTLFIVVFSVIVAVFHNTGFGQYVLLQVTSVIDAALGTSYSLKYGADEMALTSSSAYREQLKGIFKVPWLNPLLGIGRKRGFSGMVNGAYVKSVDSFYICEYIRYAYPGMFAFMGFMGYWIVKMYRDAFGATKSALSRILLVGFVCYALNLKWVDSLQTLKYMYILCALNVCDMYKYKKAEEIKSKYIRKSYR